MHALGVQKAVSSGEQFAGIQSPSVHDETWIECSPNPVHSAWGRKPARRPSHRCQCFQFSAFEPERLTSKIFFLTAFCNKSAQSALLEALLVTFFLGRVTGTCVRLSPPAAMPHTECQTHATRERAKQTNSNSEHLRPLWRWAKGIVTSALLPGTARSRVHPCDSCVELGIRPEASYLPSRHFYP